MNYYHESMGYISRSNAEIDADLNKILTLTNRIKLYHNPLVGNVSVIQNICTLAKAKGMYVVWEENNDTVTLNDSTWTSTYKPAVLADSILAQSAGADEFLIGNELSVHIDGGATLMNGGSNYVNYVNAMKALATSVKANFNGLVGIQEVWGQDYKWGNNGGRGSIDKIYFTLYETRAQFISSATNLLGYGSALNAVLGEFSTQSSMNDVAGTEEDLWADLIADRCEIIDGLNYSEAYPFTFRETGPRGYGFFDAGSDIPHSAWDSLFGGPEMAEPLGYTTRQKVERYLNRVFPEVSDDEFNDYIIQAEAYVNNFLGYNAQTTTKGLLTESIVREKVTGKIDAADNLVIDVMHPPIHFDANGNPLVSLVEFNLGGIRVGLQLTDGSTNATNSVLSVSENRKKIIYPSLYFFPAISTVTPTAKVNLFNLRDVKFWVDVSYIGGYDVVPGDITLATNMVLTDTLIMRDNLEGAKTVKQGSYQVTYDDNMANFKKVNALLQPYVRSTW